MEGKKLLLVKKNLWGSIERTLELGDFQSELRVLKNLGP